MRFAVVGTGYAADFYMANCGNHPELSFVGAYDHSDVRLRAFSERYGGRTYRSLSELLEDASVDLVLNITNPVSHFSVSRAALCAGKHVYTEKPLSLSLEHATTLVELAQKHRVGLACAPCSLLGEAAQAVWRLLREEKIGRPLLAQVALSEGMLHRMRHELWRSPTGAVWPAADEFATGSTMEHAGYILPWLTAFFGAVTAVTAASATLVPDKGTGPRVGPDYSVAFLRFENGACATVSCDAVRPPDRSLQIVGDEGVIIVDDIWNFGSAVRLATHQFPSADSPHVYLKPEERVAIPLARRQHRYSDSHDMDQMRGVAEFVSEWNARRESRLSGSRALHHLEVQLAMVETDARMQPMPLRTAYVQPLPFEPR